MTITAASILTRVNQITKRAETDIDSQLLEACNELALRTGALKSSETGTISSGTNTAAAPSDLLADESVDAFYMGTDLLDRISFAEWREGKVDGYCVYYGTIYVNPKPNSDKSYTIYYSAVHGAISTDLEFPDIYQAAIVHLTAAKIYEDYEITDMADRRKAMFEAELMKLPGGVSLAHSKSSRIR